MLKAFSVFALTALMFAGQQASAAKCFVVLDNAPVLKNLAVQMNDYMSKHENDPSWSTLRIETLKWEKGACTQAQFLAAARDEYKAKWNWEENPQLEEIRDYTGSFFKDGQFDQWFALPDVNFEKEFYNHMYTLTPNLNRAWKYMYYGISDGSWAYEEGAIVFNPNLETQYKVYFTGHP